MKTLMITLSAATILAVTSCNEAPKPETASNDANMPLKGEKTLAVDLTRSTVNWKGDMLGLYSHSGLISLKEANLTLRDGRVVGGSFVVDMNSINPTDNNYGPDNTKEKLVGHLTSPDFFDVANFPTSSFVIKDGTGATATGEFTLRGKTGNETVENIQVSHTASEVKITGTLKINRKTYGAMFDMPVKDKVISDEINLTIELVAPLPA